MAYASGVQRSTIRVSQVGVSGLPDRLLPDRTSVLFLGNMPSPPIQLFLTTIASAPQLRSRQEYILRIFQVKKIQFTSYDLASPESEDAKRLWRRKAPPNDQALPGMLVGGKWPGVSPFSFFDIYRMAHHAF